MNIDQLIDSANDIGSTPDMYHPDYGWIRVDGILTEEGKNYFQDQIEKLENNKLKGSC